MALINCPECGKQVSNKAVSCPNCGYPMSEVSVANDIEDLQDDVMWDFYTICPECGGKNPIGEFRCLNCKHKYTMGEYEPIENTQNRSSFNGIYKVDWSGNKKEVYCHRCGGSNCSWYTTNEYIPEKTKDKTRARYSVNLNPLHPFTIINKKEKTKTKVVRAAQTIEHRKIICNSCGHTFY